jgi:hypothetical protein
VTAQEQLLQLSNESKVILEAAALLDEPFSVPLLIDLGFSPDGLDPLFDNSIFRESLPDQAEFTNSELRNGLLDQISWSKKRHFYEHVGELLRKRRNTLDQAADFFAGLIVMLTLALVVCKPPKKLVIAASTPRLLAFGNESWRSGPLLRMLTSELAPLKKWRAVPGMLVTLAPPDLPGKRYWQRFEQLDRQKAKLKRTFNSRNLANWLGIMPPPSVL